MNTHDLKTRRRIRRKLHIKKKLPANAGKMRLTVYRSLNEIYAQVIDDREHKTLITASSIDKELRSKITTGVKKIEKSKLVGKLIAERALKNNIKKVAFDRNGYLYHGRVKALADAAREGGLEF